MRAPVRRSRRNRRAFPRAAALSTTIVLLAAACGGGSGGAGEVPDTVKIAVGGAFSFTYLPTYVAESQGFLAAELEPLGTEASLVNYNGSVDANKALLNNDAQYAASVASTMLNAMADGGDLRAVTQFYDSDIVVMLAREGLSTDPTELAGKRWGITSFGANNHVSALSVAAHVGLSENDIELIAVGPPASYEPAIQTNKIDVVFAGEPGAENLIESGQASLVMDLFDRQTVDDVYGGSYATSSLQATGAYLDEHRELTEAIVAAHVEALEWLQEHIDDPDAIAKALPAEMQSDNITAVIERITGGLSKDGTVLKESFENTIRATKAAGLMEDGAEFDLDTIIDNTALTRDGE